MTPLTLTNNPFWTAVLLAESQQQLHQQQQQQQLQRPPRISSSQSSSDYHLRHIPLTSNGGSNDFVSSSTAAAAAAAAAAVTATTASGPVAGGNMDADGFRESRSRLRRNYAGNSVGRNRLSSSVHATSNRDSDSQNSSGFAHCHLKDLVRILHDIKPPTIVGKRVNDANEVVELVSLPSKRVDEVYPGVFLGDYTVAESKSSLKNLNVTHVLNCAQGHGNHSVPTDEYFYKGTGMKFYGIPAVDHPGFDLSQYFHQAAEFINACLTLGGRVFVHCVQGISRSSTIVCAYLMLKKSYSAVQALSCVRRKRNVCPNEGFLQQLVELNNRLASKKDKSLGSNAASRGVSYSSFSSSRGTKNPYLSYLEPSSSSSSAAATSSSTSATNGLTSSSSSSSTSHRPHRHSTSSSSKVGVGKGGVSHTVVSSPFTPKYNSLIGMIPMKTYTTAATAAVGTAAGSGYNYRRYAI